MKQGQSTKRPRGNRGNGRRPSGGRNSNFESSGPQGKIRGTAYQVIEKYQALGRDALTFGDRVTAENYFQHAEHYYRVMAANGAVDQRAGRPAGQPQTRPPHPADEEGGETSTEPTVAESANHRAQPAHQAQPAEGADAAAEPKNTEAEAPPA